ncbi:MAG: hypothetical protein ACK58N_00090 [Synechocystis sp.]
MHPHPSQILHENDTMIVIGHQAEIPRFAECYQFKRKQLKPRWEQAALSP